MNTPRLKFSGEVLKAGTRGFIGGAAVSVLPVELAFPLGLALLIFWAVRRRRRGPDGGWARLWAAPLTAVAALVIAIALPVKQLDQRVGPLSFPRMPLHDLCRTLASEHRIFVHEDFRSTNVFLAFRTDRPMTKREVLEKLARETGCELRIGYCGTGMTFLSGGHPSFTRLIMRNERTTNAETSPRP